jgi:hypothetical protein
MAKSRKGHRKSHRKAHRKSHRRQRGGEAPVNYANPWPAGINLAQGQQFAAYHANQHGGQAPFPSAVVDSTLPKDLAASARLLPLDAAFAEIRQFGPEADLKGGSRRKGRKGRKTRKGRKGSRKQRGGLYRWGGGGRRSTAFQNMLGGRRSAFQNMMGGSAQDMTHPMDVADEGKMLIPPSLQAQAGLNPEWKLAENPTSFNPLN